MLDEISKQSKPLAQGRSTLADTPETSKRATGETRIVDGLPIYVGPAIPVTEEEFIADERRFDRDTGLESG
jgi:hypothetical protein